VTVLLPRYPAKSESPAPPTSVNAVAS
jgi:hypothetical protein